MTATSTVGKTRRSIVERALSFVRRQVTQWALLFRFSLRNHFSGSKIVDENGEVVVSVTTFAARIAHVYAAIESVGVGSVLPGRIILWVAHEDLELVARTRSLQRLVRRGLEILAADGSLGSHKKYFPALVHESTERSFLVTADDDIFYPRQWLEKLWTAFVDDDRNTIVSSWVKRIAFVADGMAPYTSWQTTASSGEDALNYFMSGSGTIYPRAYLNELVDAGETFRSLAPKADDVWLNMVAARAKIAVRQSTGEPLRIWTVPRTQRTKLSTFNVIQSLNDVQLAATYSSELITRLRTVRGKDN